MPPKPRLGRPPDADSAQTRARILNGARELFAERGYETTSNRLIAEEAGLTTGAIYHYFDRKLDIYVAVYRETQNEVYARFDEAITPHHTFVDRLDAVLETAHRLNNDDPSLARFLGTSRVDAARDPSIRRALAASGASRRREFFDELIDLGIATGELDAAQRALIDSLIQTIMAGLVDAVSADRRRHRNAIDGVMALIRGQLIKPARSSPPSASDDASRLAAGS